MLFLRKRFVVKGLTPPFLLQQNLLSVGTLSPLPDPNECLDYAAYLSVQKFHCGAFPERQLGLKLVPSASSVHDGHQAGDDF